MTTQSALQATNESVAEVAETTATKISEQMLAAPISGVVDETIATNNAAQNNQQDTPQLVSSLTVDELKEVIAKVVDARLSIFFSSLSVSIAPVAPKSSKLESNQLNVELPTKSPHDYEIQSKKENPWLKMAGKYENDPYFEQMLENIAECRREQDSELEEYYGQMEIIENKVDSSNLVAKVAAS